MHRDAYTFLLQATEGHEFKHILDVGSYDVNSSAQRLNPRELFPKAKYHGIDVRDGPGVDEVTPAADYDGQEKYDLVICMETAEHTAEPRELLDCAWRALKPGGLVVLTAAGPERAAHGVDGGDVQEGEHYHNIAPTTLRGWLSDAGWQDIEVVRNTSAGDVYATARKTEAEKKKATRGAAHE